MVVKPVIFARPTLLFLYLMAGSVCAEEGTVLFDTEQGIDKTQSPVVKEIQELSESLKNIDNDEQSGQSEAEDTDDAETNEDSIDEAEQAQPVETKPVATPEEPVPEETPIAETPTPEDLGSDVTPASEGTVLFDTEQGIDKTQSPAVKEMRELSESFKDIEDSEKTEQVEVDDTDVPAPDEEPIDKAEQPQPV